MPPELFNLEEDPDELDNRISSPACSRLLSELQEIIHADGWDAKTVAATLNRRNPGLKHIFDWAVETNITDSI